MMMQYGQIIGIQNPGNRKFPCCVNADLYQVDFVPVG